MKRVKIEESIYSIGAAVVILGALGKLTHASWGGTVLVIGMLVEVLLFLYMGAVVFFVKDKPVGTPEANQKLKIGNVDTADLQNNIDNLNSNLTTLNKKTEGIIKGMNS